MNRKRIAVIIVLCVVLTGLLAYGAFSWYQKRSFLKVRLNEESYSRTNNEAYLESFLGNDPKLLHDSFAVDVENNINDKFTKSDAYFITHRYFDNGGNIYEVYDYVEGRPELAFLKEAESVYPGIFDQIKNKTLTTVPYSTQSLYAALAYMEILDKYGYADIAAIGTLANQYAKTAYFTKKRSEDGGIPAGVDSTPVVENNTRKAISFEVKARDSMIKILEDNGFEMNNLEGRIASLESAPLKDILSHSLLVGLNQYAAALRYLEATGVDISTINSPLHAEQIFAFNMEFSKKYAKELRIFTSLLNASTLSLVTENSELLKQSLGPILSFDTKKTNPRGIVLGIINAKDDRFTGYDIYSKRNITTLAKRVPEFRTWLVSNGWLDSDFSLK